MIESAVKASANGEPDSDQAALLPPEGEEPAQGRPEGKVGRIDVVHAVLPLRRPARAAAGAPCRATRGKNLTIPAASGPREWLNRAAQALMPCDIREMSVVT